MSEIVAKLNSLPELLFGLIQTETVKIREDNGIVTLIPIKEDNDCPLFGFYAQGKLSTEKFLEQKRMDTELEA